MALRQSKAVSEPVHEMVLAYGHQFFAYIKRIGDDHPVLFLYKKRQYIDKC